jgi:hypothetical protein
VPASTTNRYSGGRKVVIHILEFFNRIGYTRCIRDLCGAKNEHVLRDTAVTRQWRMS